VPSKRLLLVEDNAPLRELVCEVLRDDGFEVVTAGDGAEALDLLRRGDAFDVVVLDDEMPRLTGRQLLSLLRAEGCQMPVVFVSGSLELSREDCARLDVGPVVRKPLLLPQLADAIRMALGSHRQR
jgi:CheY-like chemotaxis protein